MLNELAQLKDSGFGQPPPRHGLKLLYWFACDCISFADGKMIILCRPEDGDFGFHRFFNRIEDDVTLLPYRNTPFFEVGNLSEPRAEELPHYVKKDYRINQKKSNKDRIIVCLKGSSVEDIYVTEHMDQTNFDPNHTYRISQSLIQIIKNKNRKDFLNEPEYLDFIPQCLKKRSQINEPDEMYFSLKVILVIFLILIVVVFLILN